MSDEIVDLREHLNLDEDSEGFDPAGSIATESQEDLIEKLRLLTEISSYRLRQHSGKYYQEVTHANGTSVYQIFWL